MRTRTPSRPAASDPKRAALSEALAGELGRVRDAGLLRVLREIDGAQEPVVQLAGRDVLLLCSNNYLGLANHPEVVEAAREASARYGASAASSRLVSGHMRAHRAFEEHLAQWKSLEAALAFSTGYHANVGVITALTGRDDLVVSDELNHASIIDGARLSRASVAVVRHNDSAHLEQVLRGASRYRRVLVVTESVFSMDGDRAPLDEIVELAQRYGAWTMVDEAHGAGVFGRSGAGVADELGLSEHIDVHVGTLGKALASFGAYVAGSRRLVDWLVNAARPFIFTTGLPPSAVAAADAAVSICEREPERAGGLRRRVAALARRLRDAGLEVPHSDSQILPVWIGGAERTMATMHALLERGVYVAGIRPPTVPPGTSRLRLSVMATHNDAQLEQAAKAIVESVEATRELG